MNYETTPDCICGGTASLPCPNSAPDDLLACIPCHECIARYDRTHCARCDKRFAEGEGRCRFAGMHGEVFFCERCESLRPKTAEEFKAMVLRRRTATAAKKQAIDEFHRCRSSLDRTGYAASIVAMRAAEAEEKAALEAIDGD